MRRYCGRSTLLIALLALVSCASQPIDADAITDPALSAIRDQFRIVVADTLADPRTRWVAGWSGNSQVEDCPDGSVKGLCWQWQELVFARMQPTVHRVGWELVRININRDIFSEHKAVGVFNPLTIDRERLLSSDDPRAWVLDAWMHGAPDIYRLGDWVDLPWIVFEPAALEIPAERKP